jgi:hypothetical protein
MKFQDLWAGEEYAWYEDKPRDHIPSNAVRVKLIRAYKKRMYGNEKATGFAEVEILEGRRYHTPGRKVEVRVRDIIETWDEYDAIMEERRKEAEERQKQAAIEREQNLAFDKQAKEYLQRIGMPGYITTYSHNRTVGVSVGFDEFRKWFDAYSKDESSTVEQRDESNVTPIQPRNSTSYRTFD